MSPQGFRTGISALFLAALVAAPSFAQSQDVSAEIEALKQGQADIQKQLAEIIKLVKARPAAGGRAGINVENVTFILGANPMKGERTAKLTLVEFTDYQ